MGCGGGVADTFQGCRGPRTSDLFSSERSPPLRSTGKAWSSLKRMVEPVQTCRVNHAARSLHLMYGCPGILQSVTLQPFRTCNSMKYHLSAQFGGCVYDTDP